ncbi:MAG: hypothetical protein ACR2P4_04180 [Gammaproteobacteria bacterium]
MTQKITFQLDEGVCSRLALYAAQNGLGSWSEAIEDMLAKCESYSAAAPVVAPPKPAIAQPHLRSPEVIYYLDDKPVSERECQMAIIATKMATVRIFYANGRLENKQWHAANIGEDSYLRGNLNSGYLRGWRNRGIVKAEVFAGEAE